MAAYRPMRKCLCFSLAMLVIALACSLQAQTIPSQDLGINGLLQELAKLRTTARLLHSTAHPDDDDGSMLTYEARGQGATTLMLTLNRGEGGQNKFGSELFDELGLLRTLELTEADRYYGVEQRFTRVVDFGFSKTAQETFEKWGGHDVALSDLVRVIRTFRPQVIVSRFAGTERDGHGNHQAAGILTREAFRAAADPNRFPEQLQEGLLPWQAKKLYVGSFRAADEDTLRFDTGEYDPVLGMSYVQLSLEGLKHQMSQGVGGWSVPPGHFYRSFNLVDTVLLKPSGKETSFFEGIDTSLAGLATRLRDEESKVPFLRPGLAVLQQKVDEATAAFKPEGPSGCAPALLAGLAQTQQLIQQVENSSLSAAAKSDLLVELQTKREQFERASNLATAVDFQVAADSTQPSQGFFFRTEQTFLMAYPSQFFTVTARFTNRSHQTITPTDIEVEGPPGWRIQRMKYELKPLASAETAEVQFGVTVPAEAKYTRPYWHREDRQNQNVYTVDDPKLNTLPLPPPALTAFADYKLGDAAGEAHAVVKVKYVDPAVGQVERPLPVGPPLSVELDPPFQVMSTRVVRPTEVRIGIRNNVIAGAEGTLKLQAPQGWQVKPQSLPVKFGADGEFNSYRFTVTPSSLREQNYVLRATLDYGGKQYTEGYKVIGRDDIGFFYFYRAAEQQVSAVDVKVPPRLRVGFLPGTGEDIPEVLQQVGLEVSTITPEQLAGGNLRQFDTILVGIRAYDSRSDLRTLNRRLLDYVEGGGTLVVEYNASTGVFNQGHFTPFPATLSSARVTVEEAPVQILDTASPVFHYPNQIGERDFQGWVQERGLYFMSKWDSHFTPLLACHDPGEEPQKGGLLVARYGKGTYIYTGYAFFRQLPAGVPGAIRLFVNLLCAGHVPAAPAGVSKSK